MTRTMCTLMSSEGLAAPHPPCSCIRFDCSGAPHGRHASPAARRPPSLCSASTHFHFIH